MFDFVSVLTTIRKPTEQVIDLAARTSRGNGVTIAVGDRKTPQNWELDKTIFLSVDHLFSEDYLKRFVDCIPENHYCRKNIGYLMAMKLNTDWIFETDDDNLITVELSPPEGKSTKSDLVLANTGWTNIFDFVTCQQTGGNDLSIWPRGFPLENIRQEVHWQRDIPDSSDSRKIKSEIIVPIANGLVDGDPDVDAIFRLTRSLPMKIEMLEREIVFGPGSWAPFNSQNTWWHRNSFPLMYLPVTTSFRVTDILRSFVAQAICSSLGMGVRHFGPSALQIRNEHSLIEDFRGETDLYLNANRMLNVILESIGEVSDIPLAMRQAYRALANLSYVNSSELTILEKWLESVHLICSSEEK